MAKRVLVVAAHPDDEVLGVGGTILRHTAQGDRVRILIMAEGLTSRAGQRDVDQFHVALEELPRIYVNRHRICGVGLNLHRIDACIRCSINDGKCALQ